MSDFKEIRNQIVTIMDSMLAWRFPDNLIAIIDAEEDTVEASVFQEEGDHETVISLSAGLMYAIDDLNCRLFVNKDFYSLQAFAEPERAFDPGPNDHTGLWPYKFSVRKPQGRFFDYSPADNDLPKSELEGNTWLYQFITALPLVPHRLQLADLATMIATTWVIAHEQSHAKKGHLSFNDSKGRYEANLRSPDYQIPKTSDDSFPGTNYDKLMEFEADRDAIRCVIDIFFNEEIAALLPDYCEENKAVWLLRLILGSINNVLLILQNARINHWLGSPNEPDLPHPFDSHPTPRTRITVMYSSLLERLEEKNWSEVVNLTEYDFFEEQFFLKLFFDSLDDLNSASGIFSREANQQNQLNIWEEEIRPVFERQKVLHTLDEPKDVLLLTELLYKGIFPNDPGFKFFNNPEHAARLKEMSALWFDEYNNELMPGFGFIVNRGFRQFS